MKNFDTDKIIGAGLVFALIFYIAVVGIIAFCKGTVLPLDIASNIVASLAGYMGRSLLEKLKEVQNDSPKSKPTVNEGTRSDKVDSKTKLLPA